MTSPDCSEDKITVQEVYRIAIEEYRFVVRLGWDRTRFYLGLNTALVAAYVTLLRLEGDSTMPLIAVSLVGVSASFMGAKTIEKSHNYYRRTVLKKTLIEENSGLNKTLDGYDSKFANLAVSTTTSQSKTSEILGNTQDYLSRKIRFAAITGKLRALMWLFVVLPSLAIIYTMWKLYRMCRSIRPPP